MEPILKVEGLTKLFPVKKQKLLEERRFVHAVEDVSFKIGSIFLSSLPGLPVV